MHVSQSGTGRPLVLLHGWAAHGGFYRPQVGNLDRTCRLVIPDLPGHRHSPAPLASLSITGLAESLDSLLQGSDLTGAVLCGWSMGALVALEFIRRFGTARLGGLVIEDMTVRILNDAAWSLGIRNGFDLSQSANAVAAMRSDWPAYAQTVTPRLFARSGPRVNELVGWAGPKLAANDGAAMAALWESMAAQDFRSLITGIDLPVLVLHGSDSQLYEPAVSHWIAKQIRGAQCKCLTGAGHTPHLETPDAFNEAVAVFVAGLP